VFSALGWPILLYLRKHGRLSVTVGAIGGGASNSASSQMVPRWTAFPYLEGRSHSREMRVYLTFNHYSGHKRRILH
jgi:hypothetical protein